MDMTLLTKHLPATACLLGLIGLYLGLTTSLVIGLFVVVITSLIVAEIALAVQQASGKTTAKRPKVVRLYDESA